MMFWLPLNKMRRVNMTNDYDVFDDYDDTSIAARARLARD